MPRRILVVDDNPNNVEILRMRLEAHGYEVVTAADGEEGLAAVRDQLPDLILLDIMMPKLDGIEVCQIIRADPAIRVLPVVLLTALDPSERVKGLEAGADDFLTKPINQPELFARVKSLLRIKTLYDQVEAQKTELEAQKTELAQWNLTLEQRVAEGIAELERLSRMKRFFSPQVADLITSGDAKDPLKSHRSEITVVFIDLRGYTAFTESADPEEVMGVLREYHAAMGELIMAHHGTVERFAGDAIMIFFNDPSTAGQPRIERAVRMVPRDARTAHRTDGEVAKTRFRSRFRRRHCAGLRHHRRGRFRGKVGLWCHPALVGQPGLAPARPSEARPDSGSRNACARPRSRSLPSSKRWANFS